jgi:hypothetical protein
MMKKKCFVEEKPEKRKQNNSGQAQARHQKERGNAKKGFVRKGCVHSEPFGCGREAANFAFAFSRLICKPYNPLLILMKAK